MNQDYQSRHGNDDLYGLRRFVFVVWSLRLSSYKPFCRPEFLKKYAR